MITSPLIIAQNPWARLRGLLRLPQYQGILVITACKDVHTWGMKEPIDIAFIDHAGVVLASYTQVPPRQRRRCMKAVTTLERRSAPTPWFQPGDSTGLTL